MEPRCFVGVTGGDLPPIPSVMDLAQEHEIVSENTSWETLNNCVRQESRHG